MRWLFQQYRHHLSTSLGKTLLYSFWALVCMLEVTQLYKPVSQTITSQNPLSMGLPGNPGWKHCHFWLQGIHPTPRIQSPPTTSLCIQAVILPLQLHLQEAPGTQSQPPNRDCLPILNTLCKLLQILWLLDKQDLAPKQGWWDPRQQPQNSVLFDPAGQCPSTCPQAPEISETFPSQKGLGSFCHLALPACSGCTFQKSQLQRQK